MVAKRILKPTISREEDQFLSELVEKCCEFEANERIEFKSICNLIETQFSKLDQSNQNQQNANNNQEVNQKQNLNEEYKTTPSQLEYKMAPPQNDYNSMLLQIEEIQVEGDPLNS